MLRKFVACLAALVLTLLVAPVPASAGSVPDRSGAGAAPEALVLVAGTVAVDPAVAAAVLAALQDAQAGLPAMRYAAITNVSGEQDWQLVSVAGLRDLQPDGGWRLAENGAWFGLVVVRQMEDGHWAGATAAGPGYADLLAAAPRGLLSGRARQDLAPAPARAVAAAMTLRFPWQAGSKMLYGSFGVHDAGFPSWASGWKAVDFLSDGDTTNGHAPNRLLASAAGTIGAVCNDGTSVAILMNSGGSPQLMYLHLQNNNRLQVGTTFAQGEELGQLRTGGFQANCGWGSQDPGWFHVHYAFPAASGYLPIEDWTLNLTDQIWRSGSQTRSPGAWLSGGSVSPSLPAPDLIGPPEDATLGTGDPLKFTWDPTAEATEYQLVWSGGPYTNTLPPGWFAGTSYDVGQVAAGSYTWRVRARNATLTGPWSAARQFTISPVQIDQSLAITPTTAYRDQAVNASFRLTNISGQLLTLNAVGVQVLTPGCADWACSALAEFPQDADVTLAPGEAYTYRAERAFSAAGETYLAAPAYQGQDGIWQRAIPGAAGINFAVILHIKPQVYLPPLVNSGE